MATVYTTPALVGNFLKRTLTDDENAQLAVLIPAVTNWIDLKTRTTFKDNTNTQVRRLYEGGDQYIDIEPCTNVTALVLIDDYGTVNYNYQSYEYVVLPQNFNVKTQIKYRYGKFPSGSNRMGVTADFSSYDTTVPQDIQIVATRLCGVMLNAKIAQNVQREGLEGHVIVYQQHLDNYGVNDPFIIQVLQLHTELLLD